jgi:hypothetical protein
VQLEDGEEEEYYEEESEASNEIENLKREELHKLRTLLR